MKIIHAADIHLGSKIESKFSLEMTLKRRKEILDTFSRMVSFAKENDVKVILLAGDVFDKDKPAIKDKEFFYKTVKNNPEIDFLYLYHIFYMLFTTKTPANRGLFRSFRQADEHPVPFSVYPISKCREPFLHSPSVSMIT